MDPFSVLESIGDIAIALLGMAVSQPTVVAVLEWLGYRIYTVEDQHQHDVLVGVGVTVCGILSFVAFLLYSHCVYNGKSLLKIDKSMDINLVVQKLDSLARIVWTT